jgi:hypothetical protein
MTHDTESERGLPELPEPSIDAYTELYVRSDHYDDDQMRAYAIAAIEKDRASRPSPVAQDGDWVMVPMDATDAMLEAAHEEAYTWRHNSWRSAEKAKWSAMLAAATLSAPKADEEKP